MLLLAGGITILPSMSMQPVTELRLWQRWPFFVTLISCMYRCELFCWHHTHAWAFILSFSMLVSTRCSCDKWTKPKNPLINCVSYMQDSIVQLCWWSGFSFYILLFIVLFLKTLVYFRMIFFNHSMSTFQWDLIMNRMFLKLNVFCE